MSVRSFEIKRALRTTSQIVIVAVVLLTINSIANAATPTVSNSPVSIGGVNSIGVIGPQTIITATESINQLESQVVGEFALGSIVPGFDSASIVVEWFGNSASNHFDIFAGFLSDGLVGSDDFDAGSNFIGFVSDFSSTGLHVSQFDITGFLQTAMGFGDDFLLINLRAFSPNSFVETNVDIFSLDMELSYPEPVPVPAALPLFLSGLIGLGVMVRRRKQRVAAT